MIHSSRGNKLLPFLVFAICFVMLIGGVFTSVAFADNGYTPVGQTNALKIAHISDLHYFPNDLCPTEYSEDSTYALTIKEYFKLIPESGTMLNAVCEELLSKAKTDGLDAVIISGDLTKDGEKRAHIDLANRLRLLQNQIRKETSNNNFQIFVVLGNHDTFNSKTYDYLNNGEPTKIDGTTTEEFMKIYSGLGYPNFSQKEADTYSRLIKDANGVVINQKEYDTYNTPFIKFFNSENSTAFNYTYFKDSIKDYSADYAIKFYNLGSIPNTLAEKEALLKKEPQAFKLYTNLCQQNICSYIATPNTESTGLLGYDIAMLDSTLREVNQFSYGGYEHITGGKLLDTTFTWLKDNLVFSDNGASVPLADRKDTIISSLHHGTIPHNASQESLMTDFLLYDWEDAAVKLTDMGIKFTLTGHVHATDIEKYITTNGKELVDVVTGSTISYGSPVRYMTFTRASLGANEIKESVNDTVKTITSFKNIPMNLKDYDPDSAIPVLGHTIDKDKVLGKWFNDITDDGVAVNYIDDVQGYIYQTVLDNFIPNLVEGYVNDNLVTKLTSMFDGSNEIKIFAKELITQLFSMRPKYLDKTYPEGDVGEASLIDYLYTLVFDFIGHNETPENDYLATCEFTDFYTEGEQKTFTLKDVLFNTYAQYLINGEVKNYKDNTIIRSLKDYATKYVDENNNVHYGELAKIILGDPKDYADSSIEKKGGILYPLLYADNNLLDQILNFKFNFSKTALSDSALKVAKTLFGVIGIEFNETTNYSFSLNQLIKAAVKNIDPLLDDLSSLTNSSTAGMIGNMLQSLNNGNVEITDLLKGFIESYATDNFYVNISGVVFDILESFGVDANKTGNTLKLTGDGIVSNGTVYESSKVVVPDNEMLIRGVTPSLLTLTFGKNPATEMNLMWSTGTFRKSSIEITGADGAEVDMVSMPYVYGYPKFDFGLFAMFTNTSYYEQLQQIQTNGFAKTTKYRMVNKVNVTNLQPDTVYNYTITTSNSEDGTYFSNLSDYTVTGSFRTAPEAGGKFSFLGITDIQGTLQESYEIAKKNISTAITQSPNRIDFIVNGGDVTDNGKNIKQWHYALDNTLDYSSANYQTVFSKYPTVVTAGNHESSGGILSQYFNIANADYKFDSANPTKEEVAKAEKELAKSQDKGLYYSFVYSNAKFIVLNTNIAYADGLENNQLDWLISELQPENNVGIDWKIVVMHKGMYTAGSHTNDYEVEALRKQLTPIFYDYGVDIVLQGHDHTFTTTKFIDRNGKPVTDGTTVGSNNAFNKPNGVLYLTMGTIADKFYEFNSNSGLPLDETRSVMDTLTSPTYCYFTIDGKSLNIEWHSFDPTIDANLANQTMTILKTREAQVGDTAITKLYIENGDNDIDIDISAPDTMYYVPHNFNFSMLEMTKGQNSTWKYWEIFVQEESYGKPIWKTVDPYQTFARGELKLKLRVTSEDGSVQKDYPIRLFVYSEFEDMLNGILKVNGKTYVKDMVLKMDLDDHVTIDFLTNPEVTVTDSVYNKGTNTMTYTCLYQGKQYMVSIVNYVLWAGNVNVRIEIGDGEKLLLQYYVTVQTPKVNKIGIAVGVIAGIAVLLIIINLILKKTKGNGFVGMIKKHRKPKAKGPIIE